MRIKFLMSSLIITLFICPGASGGEREFATDVAQLLPHCFCHFSGETLLSPDLGITRFTDGPQAEAPLLENKPAILKSNLSLSFSVQGYTIHSPPVISNLNACRWHGKWPPISFHLFVAHRGHCFSPNMFWGAERYWESGSLFCHNGVVKCGADVIISACWINGPPVKGFGHQWRALCLKSSLYVWMSRGQGHIDRIRAT